MTALASDPAVDVPADISSTLAPGTTVGLFQIVGVLGRGGMATVYEAYDRRLERAIALKVLPPEFLHDETFARRFEQEARVIAKLEHPNIVPIYASGIDEGIPWMGMRLLTGGSMGAVLEKHHTAPPLAVQMLREVADALDYAHARGVIHRDIKPTNILRDGSGRMCVSDFGLAQMLEGSPGLTRTGTLAGTPQYMAPEQALGNPADRRSDIYSLGIVAYEMFVGEVPFKAESPVAVLMKQVNEPVPAPRDGVSPRLMRAVQKALAKDPRDRWPSAGAFVAALEDAVGATLREAEPHDVRRSEHPPRSRVGRICAGGGALVTAAGFAWFVRGGAPPTVSPLVLPVSAGASDARPAEAFAPATPATRTPALVGMTPSNPAGSRVGPIKPRPQEAPATGIEAPRLLVLPVGTGLLQTPVPPARTPTEAAASSAAETPSTGIAASPSLVADLVTPPIRVRTVSPEYPPVARAAALEGDVLVQAIVGADGKVSDVHVLQAVHPLLDEAARKAVQQYEYTPGRRNGIAESAVMRITVSFRLR